MSLRKCLARRGSGRGVLDRNTKKVMREVLLMKQIQKRRTRRLAILTGAALLGSMFYAGPALATTCAVTAPVTFKMGTAPLSGCPATTTTVAVTGSGAVTFDLSGGAFKTSGGTSLRFEFALVDSTTPNALVVNGSTGRDAVDLGSSGVNLDGRSTVEVAAGTDADPFQTQFDSYVVNGGAGIDVVAADGRSGTGDAMSEPVTLNGDADADLLYGGDGADFLNGGAGDDRLDGGLGSDTEDGGADADSFDQGAAADGGDIIIGGTGVDKIDYSDRTNHVRVTLNGAADDGDASYTAPAAGWPTANGGTAPTWTSAELDNIGNDVEQIDGGDGNDRLDATGGSTPYTIVGGAGDDWITGGPGKDRLFGLAGNDVLQGGDNRDWLTGGDGNDHEFGGAGNDIFLQERESNGADHMDGEAGTADMVSYGSRTTAVTVTLGDTTPNDGAASEADHVVDTEKVKGSRANDSLSGAGVNSILLGLGGVDTIQGGAGNDKLKGGAGNDSVSGGDGNDKVYGNAGDDTLNGNAGNDKLYGGPGNDGLTGGGGTDFGSGGGGTDTCTQLATKKGCEQ